MSTYTLYGFAMSSASQRVRSVLNYKSIPYKLVSIDFSKKEQFSPEYSKIHPRNVIPSLVTPDGKVLHESLPICEYLEEVHTNKSVLPRDPLKKSQVKMKNDIIQQARAICEIVNSSIQPYQHLYLQNYVNSHSAKKIEWRDQWVFWNRRGIESIDKIISQTKGRYCIGDELTLADILVYCQIDSAQTRFDIDFSHCKNVMDVYENVHKIEAIESARGVHQPDYPNKKK